MAWLNAILADENYTGAARSLRFLCILLAVLTMALTLLMVMRAHLPLPMMDEWDETTAAEHLHRLFAPHNEHVILFPRLIFLLDDWLFAGAHIADQAASFLVELAHAFLLAFVARRAGLPLLFRAFVFIALFWAYPFTHFIMGFQVQFLGVYAAATAAFVMLAFRRSPGLAILFGVIATFTMANGLLVALLLVPLGACLGFSRRQLVLLAAAAVAMVAGYFLCKLLYAGPVEAASAQTASPLQLLVIMVRYFGVYLGAPIGRLVFHSSEMTDAALLGCAVMGYAGTAVLGIATLLAYRRDGLRQSPAMLVLFAVAAFLIGTAVLTAMGRAGRFPLYTAATGRYGTPALIFWVDLALITGSIVRARWPQWAALPAMAAGLLGLVMAASQPVVMRAVIASPGLSQVIAGGGDTQYLFPRHLADRTGALTGVLSHVDDEAAFNTLYLYRDHHLLTRTARLEAAGIAPFDRAWRRLLGKLLPGDYRRDGGGCMGQVEAPVALPDGGSRVGGTFQARTDWIILLDANGKVAGYGLRSPGTGLLQALRNSNSHWQGHLSAAAHGTVVAYALSIGEKSLCPIGNIALPAA